MLEKVKYRLIEKLVPKIYILTEYDVDLDIVELEDGYEFSPKNMDIKKVTTRVCLTRGRCFSLILDYVDGLNDNNIPCRMYINDENQDSIRLIVVTEKDTKLFYIDASKYIK